jgi:hypothetical protein
MPGIETEPADPGPGTPGIDPRTPGIDIGTPARDTGRLGSGTEKTPATDAGGLGAPTVRGGRTPRAPWALAAAGADVRAGRGETARLFGGAACAPADREDAAGDVDAGTGATAVAGTVTAAAPAPDAGVAGGSLFVGAAATRGVARVETFGTDTAGGADTAADPVTDAGTAAASDTAATAAPAPDALTAAPASSMTLWAVDRPDWATEPGDAVVPACATWGRAKAIRAITIPIALGAPESSRPRLAIV